MFFKNKDSVEVLGTWNIMQFFKKHFFHAPAETQIKKITTSIKA